MGASNDQIYAAILALNKSMGGVQAGVKNAHEFTASVSQKADAIRGEVRAVNGKLDEHKEDVAAHGCASEKLEAHKTDEDAHGIKAERRGGRSVTYIVVAVLSIIGGLAGFLSAVGIIGR